MSYKDERLPPSKYAIIRWFGFDQFIPEQAVTSYWVSSKIFFAIRFILALYSTIVFWTYLALVAKYTDFRIFFTQFTTLTFVGLHAYLVVRTTYFYILCTFIKCQPVDIMRLSFPVFTIEKHGFYA